MICRICEKNDMESLIDLGKKPIVHHLLKNKNDSFKSYKLELGLCMHCGFMQLLHPIKPEILYENYFTISSWKRQPHVSRLIQLIDDLVCIDNSKSVLELGCNDGIFLNQLSQKGIKKCVGIEPANDAFELASKYDLDIRHGFFNEKNRTKLGINNNEFDIIVFRQVLEHIENLLSFLEGVKNSLSKNGTVVIEIPDSSIHLDSLDYCLWEEHVNYFTIDTLNTLLTKFGFEIFHYETTLFSGKALTVFAQHSSKGMVVDKTKKDISSAKLFAKKFPIFKKKVQEAYGEIDKLAFYGCGARSSNFINFMDLENVSCFIDDQVEKQNLFVPGCCVEIKPWSDEFQDFYFGLGVNSENEKKIIDKRHLNKDKVFSVLPPSRHLSNFWKSLINE